MNAVKCAPSLSIFTSIVTYVFRIDVIWFVNSFTNHNELKSWIAQEFKKGEGAN